MCHLTVWGLSSHMCECGGRLCQAGLGLPDAESWEVQVVMLKHFLSLRGPTYMRPTPCLLSWLTSQKQPLSSLGSWNLHTLSARRAVPGLCLPHGPWNGRHTQTLTATRAALCPSLQAASTSPGPVQDAGLCCHGPDTPRGCMQGAGMQMDTINKVFLIIY